MREVQRVVSFKMHSFCASCTVVGVAESPGFVVRVCSIVSQFSNPHTLSINQRMRTAMRARLIAHAYAAVRDSAPAITRPAHPRFLCRHWAQSTTALARPLAGTTAAGTVRTLLLAQFYSCTDTCSQGR